VFVWALAAFLVCGSLAGAHAALPKPQEYAKLERSVAALRDPAGPSWLSVHALYSHCRCSERILAQLLDRAATSGIQEHVLWVGPSSEREAALYTKGFRVHTVSPLQLQRDFGAVAVPLLVVTDGHDRVHYAGGYGKSSGEVRDREILETALRNERQAELPIVGCAVSRSLQKLVDPFGLKY
jgi:hypothetical protein